LAEKEFFGGESLMAKIKSGKWWKSWADTNAKNSDDIADLAEPFKSHVKEFIQALEDAGAEVTVEATRRDKKRAYLFHWSWLIALGKVKPSHAAAMAGVDIEWDHGDLAQSKAGAKEMVAAFKLAVPPKSNVAPALNSNHIAGNAIDMDIAWTGILHVKKKNGTVVDVPFMADPNHNRKLHAVGASYLVRKHTRDAPHWSRDGM
jgi:hypothetical protein